MSNRLGGKQGTAYLGTNAQQPPNWNFYPHDPTIYTYQNFSLGDLWLNTVTQQAFVLVSLERNPITNEFNAIWTDFTGTPAGVVESLQAADGTVALPVNGQIDFPNTVITANTNAVTNILTSVQPDFSNNFLINLTPEVYLRSTFNDVLSLESVTNNNVGLALQIYKSKGTIAAPLPVVATTELSEINSYGFDGTNYVIGTSITSRVPAGSVVSANCVEAEMVFITAGSDGLVPPTSVINERMVINKDGLVTINTPTAAGSALTVNGVNNNVNFSTAINANVTGTHQGLIINNTNAAAGSSSRAAINVVNQPAGTGGDPVLTFQNFGGTTPHYSLGQDTSAEQFALSKSATLGTTNIITVTNSNNQINLPQQCSFYARVAAAGLANVTGNATGVSPLYHPPFTDVIRNNSNSFNGATGRFTAPQAGMYSFSTELFITGVNNINYSLCQIGFAINGTQGIQGICNPWYRTDGAFGYCCVNNSAMIQLNQNDYVEVAFLVYNGALTVSIAGGIASYFSGQLLS